MQSRHMRAYDNDESGRPKPPPRRPPQPERLTNVQIEELAHRICWKYRHSSDPMHSHTYTFNRETLLQFARAIEAGNAT